MKSRDKKSKLLKVLQEQKKSLNLPEILQLLGPNFAERSVRRWLSDLVKENIVEKTGQKRSSRYQAAPLVGTSIFSSKSQKSIAYVKRPIFERKPIAYNKAWLDNYRPNFTYYLSEKRRKELHEHGQRAKAQDPAGTFARKIYNRLLIDLSYHSSRLEGNTYSLLETEKLIIEGIASVGKLDEEKIMILNHKEAIQHLVNNISKIKINYNEICTLHYLLSDGLVLNRYAGKMRDHGVRISASTYIPFESAEQLKNQLILITEKASEITDPFEQSFFLLTHIAYLQAFTDVNKRTSRLSANIPLLKNNLVPFSFNDINKEDYISSIIAIYELNETEPLADLYSFSYIRTCYQYDTTVNSMGFDEIRVRFRQQRRDFIRNIIVKNLVGDELDDYLKEAVEESVPKKHQQRLIDIVKEDLEEMSPQRIAGLGITKEQLQKWLKLRDKGRF